MKMQSTCWCVADAAHDMCHQLRIGSVLPKEEVGKKCVATHNDINFELGSRLSLNIVYKYVFRSTPLTSERLTLLSLSRNRYGGGAVVVEQ